MTSFVMDRLQCDYFVMDHRLCDLFCVGPSNNAFFCATSNVIYSIGRCCMSGLFQILFESTRNRNCPLHWVCKTINVMSYTWVGWMWGFNEISQHNNENCTLYSDPVCTRNPHLGELSTFQIEDIAVLTFTFLKCFTQQ